MSKKKTFAVYIEEPLLQSFVASILPEEERQGKTLAKQTALAIARYKNTSTKEHRQDFFQEKTLERLRKLLEYRQKHGKPEKDLDALLNRILDYLENDLFFITP